MRNSSSRRRNFSGLLVALAMAAAMLPAPTLAAATLDAVFAGAPPAGDPQGSKACYNDGTGGYTCEDILNDAATPVPLKASRVLAGDLDGDGDQDVVLVASEAYKCLNDAAGFDCSFLGDPDGVNGAVGDVDNDDDLDLVFARINAVAAVPNVLCLNDGNANFVCSLFGPSDFNQDVALGDLDGDGDLDLITVGARNPVGAIPPTRACFNQGGGQGGIIGTFACVNIESVVAGRVGLADLDGDGDLDALVYGFSLNLGGSPVPSFRTCLNGGAGTFSCSGTFLFATQPPRDLALGDVDADSDVDALFAAQNTVANRLCHNNGTQAGAFQGWSCTEAVDDDAFNTHGVALGDVDGDGDLDAVLAVITVGSDNRANRLCRNDGDGVFTCADLADSSPPGDYRDVVLVDLGAANQAPTADAGPDQPANRNVEVRLDGSGSFDDNTASENLIYAWTLQVPDGSISTLNGADTATPTFTPDLPGDYVATLTVTDEGGLGGDDDVVVSTSNLAPTANAGIDLLVAVGAPAVLDGGASSDPEDDALTFQWTLLSKPENSGAAIANPTQAVASLTPDLAGDYVVELVVTDAFGAASAPDSAIYTATEGPLPEDQILEASDLVFELEPEDVTTRGNQVAFLNHLRQAVAAIQAGDLDEAVDKLEKALARTDGCPERGAPDGNGPGRDWIVDCEAQESVYDLLSAALASLVA